MTIALTKLDFCPTQPQFVFCDLNIEFPKVVPATFHLGDMFFILDHLIITLKQGGMDIKMTRQK